MKISFQWIILKLELITITKISLLDSLWKRDWGELGNGLLLCDENGLKVALEAFTRPLLRNLHFGFETRLINNERPLLRSLHFGFETRLINNERPLLRSLHFGFEARLINNERPLLRSLHFGFETRLINNERPLLRSLHFGFETRLINNELKINLKMACVLVVPVQPRFESKMAASW